MVSYMSTTCSSHFNDYSIPADRANCISDENQTFFLTWSPDSNEEIQVSETYIHYPDSTEDRKV